MRRGSAALTALLSLAACSERPADPTGPDRPHPLSSERAREPEAGGPEPLRAAVSLVACDERGRALGDASAVLIDSDGSTRALGERDVGAGDDVAILVSAPSRVSALLRPVLSRTDEDGRLDLGRVVLGPGSPVRLFVEDDGGPVEGAAVYRAARGSRIPPSDPSSTHRVVTRLDHPPLTRTDATGAATVRVGPGGDAFVVRHPDRGLGFAWASAAEGDARVSLAGATAIEVAVTTKRHDRLVEGLVEVSVDLGGVSFVERIRLDLPHAIRLDRERALRIRIDARGFESVRRDVPAGVERVEIELAPTPLRANRIVATDAESGAPVPIAGVRVGRARDDEPDRIDFVPDWMSLVIPAGDDALALAPAGRHDVLVRADDYIETLVRGVAFESAEDDPAVVRVALPRAPRVRGRVLDAAGRPVSRAAVWVRRRSRDLDDLPLLWKLAGTVGLVGAQRAGDDGSFDLATSAWEALAFEAASRDARAFASVARDQSDGVDLVLSETAARGRYRGPLEGGAFETTAYLADSSRGFRLRARVASDGTFRFRGVPGGTYRLYVDRDDRALFHGRDQGLEHALADHIHGRERGAIVEVPHGGGTVELPDPPVEAPAPRPCRVALDLAGSPARIVLVRRDPTLPSRAVAHVETNRRPTVRAPDLPEGAYLAVALDEEGRPVALVDLDVSWPDTRIAIDARAARLRIRVPAEGAVSIAAHSERLDEPSARLAGLPPVASWTIEPPDSEVDVRLPAGRWTIEALDGSGRTLSSAAVDLPSGAERELDLP